MSIKGVEVTATLIDEQMTEELLEKIYLSVSSNFVFCSVDMAADIENNSINFLIGVNLADELSSSDFAVDLVRDALEKAFDDTDSHEAKFTEGKVVAFA